MARSSPKFGSVTMTPSILPLFAANSAAHVFASSRVSTAPYLLSSGPEHDRLVPGLFERRDHLFAPRLRQVIGEEAAVADDYSESHLLVHLLSSMMARSHAGMVTVLPGRTSCP